MGRATLAVENLFHPFHSIEEWIVPIPAGQFIHTSDHTFRIFFLLEGEFLLEPSGYPVMHLTKGDAYSLSFATRNIVRSPHPDREMRLHMLRLQFQWPTCQALPYRKPAGSPEKQFSAALRQRLSGFQYFPNSLVSNSIVRNILSEMEKQNKAAAWKISGLCYALTSEFLVSSPATDEESSKFSRRHRQKSAIIKHAQEYLQDNCHEALTLDGIAWKLRLSGEYLARLFKQETGRTIFTQLDHYRTEKARDLLITTEYPLSQIALACGYSTPNLFSRNFKKNIGLPPMAYRIKIRNGEIFAPSRILTIPAESQITQDERSGKMKL